MSANEIDIVKIFLPEISHKLATVQTTWLVRIRLCRLVELRINR